MLKNLNTKLVLFDLDGTLVDTAPDFVTSLNNILKKHGRDVLILIM
jgi:phosphoglycolate phosphatase